MELIEWALQLKNHALATLQLDLLRNNSIDTDAVILSIYLVLFASTMKASRAYSAIAFAFCFAISYTPLYDKLTQVQYYSLFAIIYILLTKRVKPVKAKVACGLLGSFQVLMAWDSHYNGSIETYIWLHYESIVCILHAFIIGSFLERDAICVGKFLANLVASMRNFASNRGNDLCLWYYCRYS